MNVQLCMLSVNRDGLSLKWEDSSKACSPQCGFIQRCAEDLSCQAVTLAEVTECRRHERMLSDAQCTRRMSWSCTLLLSSK